MPVDISVEDYGLAKRLLKLSDDGADRALTAGTLKTGLAVQGAVRAEIPTRVKFKTGASRKWGERNVKVKQFPKRSAPTMVVGMEAPGDPSRTDVLAKLEEDTEKRPKQGKALAINVGGEFKSKSDYNRRRPKAFDFKLRGTGEKATVLQGKSGTFMIRMPDGVHGGIFQRAGRMVKGKRRAAKARFASDIETRRTRDMSIRLLYTFTPSAKVLRRLGFDETAVKVAREEFAKNIAAAIEEQLSAGKGRLRTAINSMRGGASSAFRGRSVGNIPLRGK